ncbi:glycosyltransferase [Lysobacter niabensis]|uniref:glycosyltransferase n=1 Tax=Agrilutibacter niabensis TaxID=380628 RepID=UPI00360964BC
MKIAFHFPSLASGGAEKMRIILARELLSRGISVDFVLCQTAGEYRDQVPDGVALFDLGAKRTRNSLLPLARYLKREAPDYLISSLGPQNVIAVAAKMLARSSTRVYVTQHNALTREARHGTVQEKLIPYAYRWALPRADGVIAVSEGIARDIEVSTGFPESHVNVIYNPAHVDYTTPPALPDWLQGKRYILSIGRLVQQKAFDDLIRAFGIVHLRNPDLHLVIAGVGPLQGQLASLAQRLGLKEHVHFPGFTRSPATYLNGAQLFAMSSRFEGFGNVLVEALSTGLPVVSTDCDFGPSEILGKGEYGRLTPVGDIRALADAIDATLAEPRDAERLMSRAREFSPSAIVDRYLSILR